VVTQIFTSWNHLVEWLSQIEARRRVA
jgi:hypothetical protein